MIAWNRNAMHIIRMWCDMFMIWKVRASMWFKMLPNIWPGKFIQCKFFLYHLINNLQKRSPWTFGEYLYFLNESQYIYKHILRVIRIKSIKIKTMTQHNSLEYTKSYLPRNWANCVWLNLQIKTCFDEWNVCHLTRIWICLDYRPLHWIHVNWNEMFRTFSWRSLHNKCG